VLVTLKDDSIVAGDFGPSSFSSSDGEERDLYIECVYTIPGDGTPWKCIDGSKGIWISSGEIKTIEFFKKGV
jgi:hypothetical protein